MMLGVVTVIMNGMSNISNGVLQGIGKANIPMINAAIALVVDVVVVTVLMFVTDFGIYNVVLAMIAYALVMCILNDRALKKELHYKNPWKAAYMPALFAAVPMGVVAFAVYQGIYLLTKSLPGGNLLALMPAIVLGACVYFLLYLYFAKPKEEELAGLPGGRKLVQIARKLHIM